MAFWGIFDKTAKKYLRTAGRRSSLRQFTSFDDASSAIIGARAAHPSQAEFIWHPELEPRRLGGFLDPSKRSGQHRLNPRTAATAGARGGRANAERIRALRAELDRELRAKIRRCR